MTAQISEVALGKGDHVVCFYGSQSELFEIVGRYLADAARTRTVAIVIATDAHQRAFEEQLDAAGIDPIKARWNGALVSRDAAVTLARSMPDGRIDAGAFDRVIGGIIREASEAWRPVRVYCEMEALLWDAGDVLEAIELEQLSNQLGQQLPFSRLCAYRSASVAGHEHAAALQDVCHLHSSVLPVQNGYTHDPPGTDSVIAQVSGRFPASSDAPRAARQFVANVLQEWGYGDDWCATLGS
jgi:hypothetical protein